MPEVRVTSAKVMARAATGLAAFEAPDCAGRVCPAAAPVTQKEGRSTIHALAVNPEEKNR